MEVIDLLPQLTSRNFLAEGLQFFQVASYVDEYQISSIQFHVIPIHSLDKLHSF